MIANLRIDGRMQLTEMSRKTGIPVSTLFDRLRMSDGLISKHTCLLDFEKLGYSTRASIMLKVDREQKQLLRDFLSKHQSVNALHRINNGYDFLVEGVFRSVIDVEDFLDQLGSRFRIEDKQTFHIVEDIKREAFMSDPEFIP
jgi:DNA-binding Lrp family transcriptional regulator